MYVRVWKIEYKGVFNVRSFSMQPVLPRERERERREGCCC